MDETDILKERKERILAYMESEGYVPIKRRDMRAMLSVPQEDREKFESLINELIAEGRVFETKKGKLASPKDLQMATGTFIGHATGFGFVTPDAGGEDIFIPASETMGAMQKDRVLYKMLHKAEKGKKADGVIVRILERGQQRIVGTFEAGSKGYGFVVADDKKIAKDIFISRENTKGAVTGHKVVVEITDYGEDRRNPEGKVIEILGHINDPGVDILSVIRRYELAVEFPEEVYAEIEHLGTEVAEADKKGREDLRDLLTITIDGADAKDLDDAVSLKRLGNGNFELGVHIADVSNYVQGGSALDKEALKRGTSVYLADRVIPMLPERLSNGICSLNQGQDRLTLSCLMDIDENGTVVAHRIAETVIRVDRRMSYNQVRCILEDGDTETSREYKEFVPMFFLMKELSALLRSKRHNRGSIDFDFPESKIILNGAGRAIDVKPYEQNVATQIIEDFMLMANETVAKEYCQGEYPFVYRTHDNPDPERVESLLTLLRHQGIQVQKACEEITPKEIQEILEQIQGMPNEMMISRLMLRTMKQARYTTECSGHFGLAAKYYCHFTSPIRRYPDLQIHRIIRDNIRGRLQREGKTEHYREILEHVAEQSSVCERRAQEAERESDRLKKAEYMSYHLGEIFDGIISGVTAYGFYVELPNTVEGLVHITALSDDYYEFDEENYELRGELTKKVYHLGQKVTVRVADADALKRTVDFSVVENTVDEMSLNE